MIIRTWIKGLLVFLLTGNLFGQADTNLQMSLTQAVDYAQVNNLNIKNAAMEVQRSKKKVLETTAMGLPHVDAKGSYSYFLTLSEQVEDFAAFGQIFGYFYQDNSQLATQLFGDPSASSGGSVNSDDLKWSMTADLSVSQLIFSGPYLVGLQASKVYKSLSEVSLEITKKDVSEVVTNAYVLVLVAEESKKNIDSILQKTEESYQQFEKMYAQGFVEKNDLDQLKITLQNIKSSSLLLGRQLELANRMLKFQLSLSLNTQLTLTDKLADLVNQMRLEASVNSQLSIENNLNYQMVSVQEKLMTLNHKRALTESLPSLVAFYNHQEEFNENAFTFTPPDLVGVTISVPIFSSFERSAKVSQAKIELEKTRNSKQMATDGIVLEFEEARSSYMNALDKFQVEAENKILSETIYNNTIEKYKQGMASSFELNQAQTQFLSAQTNYYSAIMQLVSSKLKLDKIINN